MLVNGESEMSSPQPYWIASAPSRVLAGSSQAMPSHAQVVVRKMHVYPSITLDMHLSYQLKVPHSMLLRAVHSIANLIQGEGQLDSPHLYLASPST